MKLPSSKLKLTLLTTLVVFLVAIVICQVFEWLGFPEQDQVKLIKNMAGWNMRFAFTVAWILIATPVIEEFLFRYLLFRLPSRLISKTEPPQLFTVHCSLFTVHRSLFTVHRSLFTALPSSAIFSFAHYIDFGTLLAGRGFALLPISNAFVALAFVGFSWCWLYRRTGRIWCNMLSHSLFNAINLILALTLA